VEPNIELKVDDQELADALKESDRHHRVYQVVDLFEKRILQAEREEEEATVELMESSEARKLIKAPSLFNEINAE
jgi:hypothetical protein